MNLQFETTVGDDVLVYVKGEYSPEMGPTWDCGGEPEWLDFNVYWPNGDHYLEKLSQADEDRIADMVKDAYYARAITRGRL